MSQLKKEDLRIIKEDKDDFKMSVIERKNLTNEFNIHSIEQHIKALKKAKTEMTGTVSMAKAMVRNIDKNHPKIKKMKPEDRHAIWMWKDNDDIVQEGEPKIKEVEEEIKKHDEYLDVIYDAFGFQDEVKIDLSKNKDDGQS